MPYDDLPLDRGSMSGPGPGLPPEFDAPRRSPQRWVIAGALIVIAGAGLALWWMSRSQPRTGMPTPTQATDVAVGSTRPKRQPMNLPSLDASDVLLRELVAALARHPLVARFLATDEIVRNSVLAVEQIGAGKTPAVPLKVWRPESRLAIVGTASGRLDSRTYARWDSAVASLVSIEPRDAAQLYVNLKPLFDDAYRELGHPNGDFDQSIARAIDTLQSTPALDADPELVRRPGYYEHADPALRALFPVQKQFILIGSQNRARILDWLKKFAAVLEIKT
jgi:hypothetical protein